jgi:hypothetical protein
MNANFELVAGLQPHDVLVIRDLSRSGGGPHDAHKTVTNDAEAVVRFLDRSGALERKRLLYYDSDGELGELLHDGRGNFIGFHFLAELPSARRRIVPSARRKQYEVPRERAPGVPQNRETDLFRVGRCATCGARVSLPCRECALAEVKRNRRLAAQLTHKES